MIAHTEDIPTRSSGLAMDDRTFREAGHALVDRVADFLATTRDRPVTPDPSPVELRAALRALGGSGKTDADETDGRAKGTASAGGGLPEEGAEPGALLASAADLLFDRSLLNGHPRFFGYITSSPAPIGMLAELLAAAVNANVGAWTLSPVATEIEAQTVRWLAELVGYPTHGGGLLVSGGNMANITALYAARAAALGEGVRTAGVGGVGDVGGAPGAPGVAGRAGGAGRPRVYASEETHTWLQKAVDMAGLGTDAIRWVPMDEERRLDVAALRRMLASDRAAGDVPVMVVATAGTVSTGVVDPLFAVARVCREAGVWFHVDGAYGAFAAAVPGTPEDLAGMALADSLAVDPHKWLYAPLEAGCLLVRDAATLRNAFAYHPPYYHFGTEATNYVDLGPQNSRGFRALKVWLGLRQAGRRGYVDMIDRDIRLTRRLYDAIGDDPELEPLTRSLSIATFRYVPRDLVRETGTEPTESYLNVLNQELLDTIQRSGEAFVSNAVLEGRYVLRSCIVNLNTREEDVDALPGIVRRLGRQVDAGLRSQLDERFIAGRVKARASA